MSARYASHWLVLVPFAANLASLAASATLLTWVGSLQGRLAQKLMARQLWQLALADLFVCTLNCVWLLLELSHTMFGIGAKDSAALSAVCIVGMSNNVPGMVSVLIEIHIALATVASLFRCTNALRQLSKILPLAWPLGVLFGGVVVWLSDGCWDAKLGVCNSRSLHGEFVHVSFLVAALALCTGTYIASVVMAMRHAGSSVETRMWRRGRWFVVAGVVSWLPWVIFIYWFQSDDSMVNYSDGPVFFVAVGFLDSNGLLNAAVYALQCRYLRQRRRRARGHRLGSVEARAQNPHLSFNVQFDLGSEGATASVGPADASDPAERLHDTVESVTDTAENPEGDLLTFLDEPTVSLH